VNGYIRCANECEAWAKAIREYAELGIYSSMAGMMMGQYNSSTQNSFVDEDDEDDEVIIDKTDDTRLEVPKIPLLGVAISTPLLLLLPLEKLFELIGFLWF
jgi:hypothetical protein